MIFSAFSVSWFILLRSQHFVGSFQSCSYVQFLPSSSSSAANMFFSSSSKLIFLCSDHVGVNSCFCILAEELPSFRLCSKLWRTEELEDTTLCRSKSSVDRMLDSSHCTN